MANQEHVRILRQGAGAWENWRGTEGCDKPDLSEADLPNLDCRGWSLQGVNFQGSRLTSSRFWGAKLEGADFRRANLSGCEFMLATMDYTNLSQCNLEHTVFENTVLDGARLEEALFAYTHLAATRLRDAVGLEATKHGARSFLDTRTLMMLPRPLPMDFLRNCGVPKTILDYLPSLIASLEPFKFYSCFISYSHQDREFARQLHQRLEKESIDAWIDHEDLKIGDEIRQTIDAQIRLKDKVLVIISEHSIGSQRVQDEVEAAMEAQRRRKKPVLFPITLDDDFLKTEEAWVAAIRRDLSIGNFRDWKDPVEFEKAFARLLRDLKNEKPLAS